MSGLIYCGNGKEKFNGDLISVMLNVDVLSGNFNEHGFTTEAGKRMIKINVRKSNEVDQYGNTHYVVVDTWKPEQLSSNTGQVKKVFQDDIPGSNPDSIPF